MASTYFGCREPHYPLELLFARHDQIITAGHESTPSSTAKLTSYHAVRREQAAG